MDEINSETFFRNKAFSQGCRRLQRLTLGFYDIVSDRLNLFTSNAYAICGKKYDIVNEVADVGDSSILSGHRISLSRSHPFEGRRSFVELRQECGVRIVRSYYSRRMNVEIGSRSSEGGIRRINIRRNLSMCVCVCVVTSNLSR